MPLKMEPGKTGWGRGTHAGRASVGVGVGHGPSAFPSEAPHSHHTSPAATATQGKLRILGLDTGKNFRASQCGAQLQLRDTLPQMSSRTVKSKKVPGRG